MDITTTEIIFPLPGKDIKLKVVKDVESLITDPEDEDKVPCWAEIWPAARGLALWVWCNLSFDGEDMLELGTGLGLPGIICALKGAKVTFSDFNQSVLELAMENARVNGVSNIDSFLGDWRRFNLKHRFQWILCSDVTYDPKLNVYLLDIIKRNLAPGGSLLISHPGRKASFEFMQNLLKVSHWERFDTQISITVDDPILSHYNIHIHYWKQRIYNNGPYFPAALETGGE